MNTKRQPEETETQYIWRICSAKDAGILDITWDEVADILNRELRDEGEYYTSSAYRKKYQQAKLFKDEVFSKETDKEAEEKYLEQKRELERLKIAYRDQRNSWSRENYITSRIDQNLDYLAEQLQKIGRREFLVFQPDIQDGDRSLIVCLSDLHIGQTFSSAWGEYNSDIAHQRLEEYMDKIAEIKELYPTISDVTCCLLGDQISGNNHLSIQVSNRENLIDQVKLAIEEISNFVTELSEMFSKVTVVGIAGNHSRVIADRNKDVKDERLDSLITWSVGQITAHIPNVTVITDNLDSTVTKINVRGKDYVLTHGDMTDTNDSSISKLVMALGSFPYAVLCGHKHSPMFKEVQGLKIIQSGSLAGSGDDYCITKRLTGRANQTLLVTNEDGEIDAIYNVDLS